jgi:hypothetical protein
MVWSVVRYCICAVKRSTLEAPSKVLKKVKPNIFVFFCGSQVALITAGYKAGLNLASLKQAKPSVASVHFKPQLPFQKPECSPCLLYAGGLDYCGLQGWPQPRLTQASQAAHSISPLRI